MRIYGLKFCFVLFCLMTSCLCLLSESLYASKSERTSLNGSFKGLEKEMKMLLQIMRPFSSISLSYQTEGREGEGPWKKGAWKYEFYWDRHNDNYRYNKVCQLEKKNLTSPAIQVIEQTCRNSKVISFVYEIEGEIESFQLPEMKKIKFDKNSLVILERPMRFPIFPCTTFPNLQYPLNGRLTLLADVLDSPNFLMDAKMLRRGNEELFKITISVDKKFPRREDFVFEFDLLEGVLLRSMTNIYGTNGAELLRTNEVILDDFVEIKGWKIPMRSTHSTRDKEGKLINSTRFIIDRQSFKINESIPSEIFMPRIAQPVTIYDRELGITFKSSVIPDSTTDAIAAELDGLLGHELKSSKIKQQLK